MPSASGSTPQVAGAPLSVDLRWCPDGQAEIRVLGELDHQTTPTLMRALEMALTEGERDVLVDLSRLTFCDAGGVSCFIDAGRRLAGQGRQMRLVRPQPAFCRLVSIMGVGYLLG